MVLKSAFWKSNDPPERSTMKALLMHSFLSTERQVLPEPAVGGLNAERQVLVDSRHAPLPSGNGAFRAALARRPTVRLRPKICLAALRPN